MPFVLEPNIAKKKRTRLVSLILAQGGHVEMERATEGVTSFGHANQTHKNAETSELVALPNEMM